MVIYNYRLLTFKQKILSKPGIFLNLIDLRKCFGYFSCLWMNNRNNRIKFNYLIRYTLYTTSLNIF